MPPSLQNQLIGDDPDAMLFIPCGGDPDHNGFDKDDYALQHKCLAWEDRLGKDPDCRIFNMTK